MSSSFSTPHNDCGLSKIKDICSNIKCSVLSIFDINYVEVRFIRGISYKEFNFL